MKTLKTILVIFATLLILASCVSYPVNIERFVRNTVVWDETLPKEESVLLHFPHNDFSGGAGIFNNYSYTVTGYNGMDVNWSNTVVYLPPGRTQLLLTIKIPSGTMEKSFERTFKAGERYSVLLRRENGIAMVILEDLNEKKASEDQIAFYLERAPKMVLPGDPVGRRQEGEATVVFGKGIFAYNINGVFVYDDFYPVFPHKWRVNTENIPAGSSTINFNFHYLDSKINLVVFISGENLEFTHTFEAGKNYTIAMYDKQLNPFVTEYGVAIYDSTTGKEVSANQIIKSWKLMEYNRPSGKFTQFSPVTGEPIPEK